MATIYSITVTQELEEMYFLTVHDFTILNHIAEIISPLTQSKLVELGIISLATQ